jgi:hypothetical protein
MVITILARYPKDSVITPDPAVVRLGERVSWLLRFENRSYFPKSINWTVYFRDKHPFGGGADCVLTDVAQEGDSTQDAGETRERGEHKYGVRLVNAENNETISDDDPILTVV